MKRKADTLPACLSCPNPGHALPRKSVMISINTSWNVFNFRAGLIKSLGCSGFEIVAAAPFDSYSIRLSGLGCRHIALPMDNMGSSPLHDALLFLRYLRLLLYLRPNVFLPYTIKPNIYGSLAAHMLGIPVINNISGLGTVFLRETWLTKVVKLLYRLALRNSHTVFFQNDEDRSLFIRLDLVQAERTALLPGSGIDLDRFAPDVKAPEPGTFLLIARLIWDKGVGEYVEAAKIVRQRFPWARFQILGFLDVENRSAISHSIMNEWVSAGHVEYLGTADDVRPTLAAAACVVLPSYYREGTPRALLEAAAMAKPIITTDAPGCRNVVDDGVNGFLCAIRDPFDLAEKLIAFLNLDPAKRDQMGLASRRKAEAKYDERVVVADYLAAIAKATIKAQGDYRSKLLNFC